MAWVTYVEAAPTQELLMQELLKSRAFQQLIKIELPKSQSTTTQEPLKSYSRGTHETTTKQMKTYSTATQELLKSYSRATQELLNSYSTATQQLLNSYSTATQETPMQTQVAHPVFNSTPTFHAHPSTPFPQPCSVPPLPRTLTPYPISLTCV